VSIAIWCGLTEANHDDNEFYELGGAAYASESECSAFLDALPRGLGDHDCSTADQCYFVDVLSGADGFSCTDSIEVTAVNARTLVGVDDLATLRHADKEAG
jgi:hypothetical protein